MSENENALRLYHMAERKLKPYFKDGKLPITAWRRERDRLEQEYKIGQVELSPIHAEVKKLWQIKYKVEQIIHEQERQNAVTRQKKQKIREVFLHRREERHQPDPVPLYGAILSIAAITAIIMAEVKIRDVRTAIMEKTDRRTL